MNVPITVMNEKLFTVGINSPTEYINRHIIYTAGTTIRTAFHMPAFMEYFSKYPLDLFFYVGYNQ